MPLVQTRGAASAQGFGEFAQVTAVNYIEDVFSCFLYTGTGSSQTITNNIDLSTKGGLVWLKIRSSSASHFLVDTVRGGGNYIVSNSTAASSYNATVIPTFNANGFDTGGGNDISAATYASWTFRKQPKFFDVVTYTGNGVAGRAIPHNLGSAPGCIIVKTTNAADNWAVYHRSLSSGHYIILNSTSGSISNSGVFTTSPPTNTDFIVGADNATNFSGRTYVAYLFAHDAGGFGLSGTDNVISCGSFTTSGTSDPNATVNLGYEPQWVMIKKTTASTGHPSDSWIMYDTMRGLPVAGGSASRALYANESDAEGNNNALKLTSVGFNADTGSSGITYIYIAIRRGPMRTPTDATKVYKSVAYVGTEPTPQVLTAGFPVDLWAGSYRSLGGDATASFYDRLRGINQYLLPSSTAVEAATGSSLKNDSNTGVTTGTGWLNNTNANGAIAHFFRRAPSFFDVVCYTGDNVGTAINHNLTVVPELIINKSRNSVNNWFVYAPSTSATYGNLNTTAAFTSLGSQVATASTYDPISYALGTTYVTYLFATCAGVSKVGSYTGTGALQTVNCGFTGGARFVLIKRTDSTGNWWVYDSARGITSGNDPYLYLNSAAAEVTGTNYVDTDSTGFKVTAAAPAELNALYGTYIFLAIA